MKRERSDRVPISWIPDLRRSHGHTFPHTILQFLSCEKSHVVHTVPGVSRCHYPKYIKNPFPHSRLQPFFTSLGIFHDVQYSLSIRSYLCLCYNRAHSFPTSRPSTKSHRRPDIYYQCSAGRRRSAKVRY